MAAALVWEPVEPVLNDGARRIVLDLCRRGARTAGIDEREHRVKAHLFRKRERIEKILLRLAREADDHVGREDEVWNVFPREIDLREILFRRIAAVHGAQDPVAAGLHGQMDVRGALFALGHGSKKPLGRVAVRKSGNDIP